MKFIGLKFPMIRPVLLALILSFASTTAQPLRDVRGCPSLLKDLALSDLNVSLGDFPVPQFSFARASGDFVSPESMAARIEEIKKLHPGIEDLSQLVTFSPDSIEDAELYSSRDRLQRLLTDPQNGTRQLVGLSVVRGEDLQKYWKLISTRQKESPFVFGQKTSIFHPFLVAAITSYMMMGYDMLNNGGEKTIPRSIFLSLLPTFVFQFIFLRGDLNYLKLARNWETTKSRTLSILEAVQMGAVSIGLMRYAWQHDPHLYHPAALFLFGSLMSGIGSTKQTRLISNLLHCASFIAAGAWWLSLHHVPDAWSIAAGLLTGVAVDKVASSLRKPTDLEDLSQLPMTDPKELEPMHLIRRFEMRRVRDKPAIDFLFEEVGRTHPNVMYAPGTREMTPVLVMHQLLLPQQGGQRSRDWNLLQFFEIEFKK